MTEGWWTVEGSYAAAGHRLRLSALSRRKKRRFCGGGSGARLRRMQLRSHREEDKMRSCLLWLIGVPIPIIILLWLITGHA